MKTGIPFSLLLSLLCTTTIHASPCSPLMIFDNQTTLRGYYFGNDASQPMSEINSIDVSSSEPKERAWPSTTCQVFFDSGDKNTWDSFSRVLTKMSFYTNDAVQKEIRCNLPDDASLKNTKSMTTTVSKNAAGEVICQVTRQADSSGSAKFFAFGVPSTILISDNAAQWSQIQAPDSYGFFRNMTHGKDNYVAVGSSYYNSTDGINWNRTNGAASDVLWTNNQFYSAGGSSSACKMPLCTSQDGKDWKAINFYLYDLYLRRFAKNDNNTLVAVGMIGNNGVVVTSVDGGTTWVKTFDMPSLSLMNVTWGNKQFVAVGTAGQIFTSADGVNWKAQQSGTTEMLQSVTWGNDKFVVVGGAYTNVILTSTNGVTWSPQSASTTNALTSVNWMNNKFIAVGNRGTLITSTDGIHWTAQSSGTSNDLIGLAQP